MNLQHKRILLLISCIFLIGAIVLMCLPIIQMAFSGGPGTPQYIEYYSYYSMDVLGYLGPFPVSALAFAALWLLLSLWKTAANQEKGSGVLYWVLVAWVLLQALWPVAVLFPAVGYTPLVALLLLLAAAIQIFVYRWYYVHDTTTQAAQHPQPPAGE